MNPWLGAKRGHLSDWATQQWVRRTGRCVDLRTDHTLRLYGRTSLRLHYTMQES